MRSRLSARQARALDAAGVRLRLAGRYAEALGLHRRAVAAAERVRTPLTEGLADLEEAVPAEASS